MGFLSILKTLFGIEPNNKRKRKKRAKGVRPRKKTVRKRVSRRTSRKGPGRNPGKKASKTVRKKSAKSALGGRKKMFSGKAKRKTAGKTLKRAAKKLKFRKRPAKKSSKCKINKRIKRVKEKQIGMVTHYFGKISVGIIKPSGPLSSGEWIHIKGAHDDFIQLVKSIQLNHKDIKKAKKGDEIGIKVIQPVHENDRVFIASTES